MRISDWSSDVCSSDLQVLNEMADAIWPGKYQSDFAMQVTSEVMNAQTMTVQFANNNLGGRGNFDESYVTGKTRVCVTVGMMTTGYDCPDILNLAMMRPVFSPSEFVQLKGSGTRKPRFAEAESAGRRVGKTGVRQVNARWAAK